MIVSYGLWDLRIVLRDVGEILRLAAIAFIVPLIASVLFLEFKTMPEIMFYYAIAGLITFLLGIILKTFFRSDDKTTFKHAFLVIVLVWLIFVGLAALPFSWILGMPFLDAYFESMSALTTTGLSIMMVPAENSSVALLDIAPLSLIFWRSFLSWVGGIGIVVLALMGLFGYYTKAGKLIIAEGREERLKANLMNSVREIWAIYIIMTLLGAVMLYLSGMDPFNALNYSMSAISTTGMSTTSIGLTANNNGWLNEGLHNFWVDISLIIIMIMGATSFYVHYLFRKKNYRAYFEDAEFKALLAMGFLSSLFIIPKLGIENAIFYAFSAITCGGFDIVSVSIVRAWPDFVKLVLIAAMFIGGSSGSTAGGIKISRFLVFLKSIGWKAKEVLLPKDSFFPKRFEGRNLSQEEIAEVHLFILLYCLFIVFGIFVLTFNGEDLSNSLFEVVSAQGNAGLSAGITKPGMEMASELMLIINMFVGRLEIIPIFSILGFVLHLRKRKR